MPATTHGAETRQSGLRARDAVLIIVVLAALVFAFRTALASMVQVWDASPMYSYGFAVPVISCYLLWSRRRLTASLTPAPRYVAGSIVLVGCLLIGVSGRAAGVQVLEQVAFVVSLSGVVLLLLGREYLRAAWAPLAYLIFMVPLWDGFTEPLHLPFQLRSAEIGAAVLRFVGIPAYREGVVISLPGLTLEVARACSGVNYLVAVLALGVPLSYLYLPRLWRRVLLIGSAVAVAALSNGLRVALIGVLAHWQIGSPLHGPFHVLHGLFVAAIGYVALFAGLRLLRDRRIDLEGAARGAAAARVTRVPVGAAACVMVVAVLVGANVFVRSGRVIAMEARSDALPARMGDWSRDAVLVPAMPKELSAWSGADVELRGRYRRADGEVADVYVAYLAAQDQHTELVNHRAGELHARATPLPLTSSRVGAFRANLVRARTEDVDVAFWYAVGCAPNDSKYAVKARTMFTAMLRGESNGAVIAIIARSRRERNPEASLREIAGLIEASVTPMLPGCGARSND